MNEINSSRPRRRSVGLWLLCGLFLVWGPVNLGVSVSSAMSALPVRGIPLGLLIIARVLVAGLGIAAGLALLNRQASARQMAQLCLVVSAGLDVVRYTTPYYPSNHMPGDDVLYLAGSLVYHGAWLTYLWRSSHVAREFA